MQFLEINDLSKSFGGVRAVDRFNIQILSGEIVGLVGPNGAGKSTVFNLITGSLRPDKGHIRYKGEVIDGLRPDQIAKKGIGRTFQLANLFYQHTTLENLLAGYARAHTTGFWQSLLNTSDYQADQNRALTKAIEVLDLLKLSKWKDTLASALPCGTQRFLGIGQAIMAPTELLLLDEPFNGLSEEDIAALLDILRKLRRQGITIFIIGHHMRAMMSFCERIAVINFGIKIAEGTPEVIKGDSNVVRAYLGSKRQL